jgi:hypothetical protein
MNKSSFIERVAVKLQVKNKISIKDARALVTKVLNHPDVDARWEAGLLIADKVVEIIVENVKGSLLDIQQAIIASVQQVIIASTPKPLPQGKIQTALAAEAHAIAEWVQRTARELATLDSSLDHSDMVELADVLAQNATVRRQIAQRLLMPRLAAAAIAGAHSRGAGGILEAVIAAGAPPAFRTGPLGPPMAPKEAVKLTGIDLDLDTAMATEVMKDARVATLNSARLITKAKIKEIVAASRGEPAANIAEKVNAWVETERLIKPEEAAARAEARAQRAMTGELVAATRRGTGMTVSRQAGRLQRLEGMLPSPSPAAVPGTASLVGRQARANAQAFATALFNNREIMDGIRHGLVPPQSIATAAAMFAAPTAETIIHVAKTALKSPNDNDLVETARKATYDVTVATTAIHDAERLEDAERAAKAIGKARELLVNAEEIQANVIKQLRLRLTPQMLMDAAINEVMKDARQRRAAYETRPHQARPSGGLHIPTPGEQMLPPGHLGGRPKFYGEGEGVKDTDAGEKRKRELIAQAKRYGLKTPKAIDDFVRARFYQSERSLKAQASRAKRHTERAARIQAGLEDPGFAGGAPSYPEVEYGVTPARRAAEESAQRKAEELRAATVAEQRAKHAQRAAVIEQTVTERKAAAEAKLARELYEAEQARLAVELEQATGPAQAAAEAERVARLALLPSREAATQRAEAAARAYEAKHAAGRVLKPKGELPERERDTEPESLFEPWLLKKNPAIRLDAQQIEELAQQLLQTQFTPPSPKDGTVRWLQRPGGLWTKIRQADGSWLPVRIFLRGQRPGESTRHGLQRRTARPRRERAIIHIVMRKPYTDALSAMYNHLCATLAHELGHAADPRLDRKRDRHGRITPDEDYSGYANQDFEVTARLAQTVGLLNNLYDSQVRYALSSLTAKEFVETLLSSNRANRKMTDANRQRFAKAIYRWWVDKHEELGIPLRNPGQPRQITTHCSGRP